MVDDFKHSRKGAAAIEFALIAPLLFLLVFAIVDMGIYFAERTMSDRVVDNLSDAIRKTPGSDAALKELAQNSDIGFINFKANNPDNFICAKSYPTLAAANAPAGSNGQGGGGCKRGDFSTGAPSVGGTLPSMYYVYLKASAEKLFHIPIADFMPTPIVSSNIILVQTTESGMVVAFDKAGCDGTAIKCCPNDTDWEIYSPANGRAIIGVGNSGEPYSTFHANGAIGGEEKHKLEINEMPKHHHTISELLDTTGPSGIANDNNGGFQNVDTNDVGGDDPHNNMMPFKTLAYCKKK